MVPRPADTGFRSNGPRLRSGPRADDRGSRTSGPTPRRGGPDRLPNGSSRPRSRTCPRPVVTGSEPCEPWDRAVGTPVRSGAWRIRPAETATRPTARTRRTAAGPEPRSARPNAIRRDATGSAARTPGSSARSDRTRTGVRATRTAATSGLRGESTVPRTSAARTRAPAPAPVDNPSASRARRRATAAPPAVRSARTPDRLRQRGARRNATAGHLPEPHCHRKAPRPAIAPRPDEKPARPAAGVPGRMRTRPAAAADLRPTKRTPNPNARPHRTRAPQPATAAPPDGKPAHPPPRTRTRPAATAGPRPTRAPKPNDRPEAPPHATAGRADATSAPLPSRRRTRIRRHATAATPSERSAPNDRRHRTARRRETAAPGERSAPPTTPSEQQSPPNPSAAGPDETSARSDGTATLPDRQIHRPGSATPPPATDGRGCPGRQSAPKFRPTGSAPGTSGPASPPTERAGHQHECGPRTTRPGSLRSDPVPRPTEGGPTGPHRSPSPGIRTTNGPDLKRSGPRSAGNRPAQPSPGALGRGGHDPSPTGCPGSIRVLGANENPGPNDRRPRSPGRGPKEYPKNRRPDPGSRGTAVRDPRPSGRAPGSAATGRVPTGWARRRTDPGAPGLPSTGSTTRSAASKPRTTSPTPPSGSDRPSVAGRRAWPPESPTWSDRRSWASRPTGAVPPARAEPTGQGSRTTWAARPGSGGNSGALPVRDLRVPGWPSEPGPAGFSVPGEVPRARARVE